MVFYLKLQDGDPVQFTTALEAKEYIAANFDEAVFLAYQDEPAEYPADLDYLAYDSVDEAKEAVDAAREEMAGE